MQQANDVEQSFAVACGMASAVCVDEGGRENDDDDGRIDDRVKKGECGQGKEAFLV